MTKHSKNNTASSIFSYAEHKKLDYGTKRQRLGNESMRRFDACALCLQRARTPLACGKGHLFCKECVYSDLLGQKKEMKRQKERIEVLRREEAEERERVREAARQRVLKDFERGQLGFSGTRVADKDKGAVTAADDSRGTKRKFDFDLSKAEVMAREAEEAALRQIELEQAQARKSKLPDFWLPSLTPTAAAGPLKDIKLSTVCRAAHPAHPLALKTLIPVLFSSRAETFSNSDASKSDESDMICPSCKKELSNHLRICVLKPCTHVVCKPCVDALVHPSGQCVVCDHALAKDDIIELQREGTGYAGGGMAETSRKGVAFQG